MSKLTNLDWNVFLLNIKLDKEISWPIPLRRSSFAISVIVNVESDPVSNNAFVSIVLLPLFKVTGMISRKVEGDVSELDDSSLLETNSFVLSLWSKVWCFWEQPSFQQVNFDGQA